MVSVVEPIYKNFLEISASDMENLFFINVSEDGSFTYNHYLDINAMGKSTEKKILFNEDGTATITYSDVTIKVNQYGIEEEYSDGNWMDLFSTIKRKNGIITEECGNDESFIINKYSNFDNGSWNISHARGMRVPHSTTNDDFKEKLIRLMIEKNLSKETVLSEFDRNSATIISEYPNTANWYALTRKYLEEILPDRVSKEEYSRIKISSLEKQVSYLTKSSTILHQKNSALKEEQKKLTMMLERALLFIENVKNHPAGQLFFTKKIKEFELGKETLDAGKD